MLEAVTSPWRRVEPFLLDRSAVNKTLTESAVLDSSQGVAHLVQQGRIGICLGKLLVSSFVAGAVVTDVAGWLIVGFTSVGHRSFKPSHEFMFLCEQLLFVWVCVHACPPGSNPS